jgi:NAD(P)-dependent dehydrogenase (short-subunit alcohol dehydrogenase family)
VPQVDLHGRRAVVTGAGRGFGRAVALAYARAGASLLITARSGAELARTREAIVAEVPGARVEFAPGDVSLAADVRRAAELAQSALGGTDVLVCNAGVYGPKGPIETVDFDEWTRAVDVNLSGVVLCAREFSAQLKASERGKVVILSGGGATKPMPFLSAYAASKAAVVRFGETLAEEWLEAGVDVNMVAPGALNTRLLEEILDAGPAVVGEAFYSASVKQKATGGSPLERGADLCAFLGSRTSDGITGKLVSAIWDPWERFPELRERIMASDVYTLRRIVPEERGLTL